MSKALKATFIIFAVILLLFGGALLIAPGSFLALFNWKPVDPLMSRLLGAAMLGLAWGSFLGFRTTENIVAKAVLQIELVFSVLGAVGFARHLFFIPGYFWPVWAIFIVLIIFAILWLIFLLKKR